MVDGIVKGIDIKGMIFKGCFENDNMDRERFWIEVGSLRNEAGGIYILERIVYDIHTNKVSEVDPWISWVDNFIFMDAK
jgi:hypothetical protein